MTALRNAATSTTLAFAAGSGAIVEFHASRPVGVAGAEGDNEDDTVDVPLTLAPTLGVGVGETVGVSLRVPDAVLLLVTLGVADGVARGVPDPVLLPVTLGVTVDDLLGVPDVDGVSYALVVELGDGAAEADAKVVAEPPPMLTAPADAVVELVRDGARVPLPLAVAELQPDDENDVLKLA